MHSLSIRGIGKSLHSSSDVSTGSLIEVPASSGAENCSNESWSSFGGDRDQLEDRVRSMVHENFLEEVLEGFFLF